LDGGGHVVLQVRILSDRLQLRGEWRNRFGKTIEIGPCRDKGVVQNFDCTLVFGPALPEAQNETFIEPLFEYPSSEHLGELRKRTAQ
jgi:hypothetical protein